MADLRGGTAPDASAEIQSLRAALAKSEEARETAERELAEERNATSYRIEGPDSGHTVAILDEAAEELQTARAELAASQEEITRLRKALEEAQAWREMAEAGLELADYASYAEIVGAIRHNGTAIREWCDKVFDFHRAREKAEWDRLVAEDEASRALLPTHPHEGDSA